MATALATKTEFERATAARWFERFKDFGQSPSVDGFMGLLNSDVVMVDSGLTLSYSGSKVDESIRKLLSAIPDLQIKPIRHRTRGNSIFVETENSGTHSGEKLSWSACYAVSLTGLNASRFRIYSDHAVMLRPFLQDAPPFPGYAEEWDQSVVDTEADPPGRWEPSKFVDAYQAVWRNPSPMGFTNFYTPAGTILNPGMPRPIVKAEIPGYYAWLMRRVPHVHMALLDWAGDRDLVYAEWIGAGLQGELPFTVRVVDVFHFDDRGVHFGQAYYDTLKTILRLKPGEARHREPFFIASQ
ncbi:MULTISPECIES: nuclear transport factor 2 family protein [Bradyrhizobium]|uniref:nuclear transport factor 2 family protein n=1 Tax=Bradyrhizobium TaxID=374 RepID=UPI000482D4F8|nr:MULTISPECIES: nuclear transport factor 2 family protein [Bradyrhizobium]UFW46485.1 nuclear transport factor 2 family protein [Bradyrhizobium arachidis]